MDETQKPTLKVSYHKPSRRYTFNANAREVRNFFMRGEENGERKIGFTHGDYFILGRLNLIEGNPFPETWSRYGGPLWVSVGRGDGRNLAEFEKDDWLIDEKIICEIAISQDEEGKCKASLYITDFELWLGGDEDKFDRTAVSSLCISFITGIWLGTIEDWEKNRSAPDDPTTMKEIIRRIADMHSDLSDKLGAIKLSQKDIYQRLNAEAQIEVDLILQGFRESSILQADMQRTLDAIRRALKYALNEGILINDPTIKQSLSEINRAVNSNADLEQQLELSLPIIPFLLQYKLTLGAGVDLNAVWSELQERSLINKSS